MLTQFLSGSNDMRKFSLNDVTILITGDTLDGIYFPHYLLIVEVLW